MIEKILLLELEVIIFAASNFIKNMRLVSLFNECAELSFITPLVCSTYFGRLEIIISILSNDVMCATRMVDVADSTTLAVRGRRHCKGAIHYEFHT